MPQKSKYEFVKQPANVLTYQLGLDLGLYNTKTSEIHILNPVAASIWSQLISGRKPEEIADSISVSFSEPSADPKEVIRDVENIIRFFSGKKLVEKAPRTKKETIAIVSEYSMSQLPISYFRPQVKTYSKNELDELNRNYSSTAVFCDLIAFNLNNESL
ncbi:MAG: PqqD family protein [Ginsengibacter sp.]